MVEWECSKRNCSRLFQICFVQEPDGTGWSHQKSMDAGLRRMNTDASLHQFVELWKQLRHIQLSYGDDTIKWNLNALSQYTATSACEAQFCSAFAELNWDMIWKSKVLNKCKFFTWLLLQCRLPTNDRIIKRGGQADPICQLCHTTEEKTLHMIAKCSYAAQVWNIMTAGTTFPMASVG